MRKRRYSKQNPRRQLAGKQTAARRIWLEFRQAFSSFPSLCIGKEREVEEDGWCNRRVDPMCGRGKDDWMQKLHLSGDMLERT